jgi:hypothetical protein
MKDNKRIRRAQFLRSWKAICFFLVINLVLRLAITPLNDAEYTDGILQLTQFANQTGIYPPLYTLLCWPLAQFIGGVWAGRIVSAFFSALAVIPIYLMAHRSYGGRAAFFAALLYTVAPVSLRWAPRVMTESVFSFFFWFSCERIMAAYMARDPRESNSALLWAGILGALSALTRYQGVLLVAPVLCVAWMLRRRTGLLPWKGLLGLLAYASIPIWSTVTNTIHGGQFAERVGDVPLMTFILNAEPFVLYFPYFLTYPVAILVMMGMIKGRARRFGSLLPLTLYVFAVLLFLQSLFGSFQERYFLPLFGLFYIWGGLGMACADHSLRRRNPALRPYVPIVACTWSLFIAVLVLLGSRQAFGDIRAATEAAAVVKREEGGRIFTNEIYRAERAASGKEVVLIPDLLTVNLGVSASPAIVANKVEFFANTNVFYLHPEYYEGRLLLKAGDLLVLSDIYGADEGVRLLREHYLLRPLGTFESVVIPVFPDIMSTPGTAQNPAAFLYRYSPQPFRTFLVRVEARLK